MKINEWSVEIVAWRDQIDNLCEEVKENVAYKPPGMVDGFPPSQEW